MIPDSVTSVGYSAFSGCTNLTAVKIGGGVTDIGWFAFSGCHGLTSVTIPDGVTDIFGYAFSDCLGLTNVTIGDTVGFVDEVAFGSCPALTTVTIGRSVTNIDYLAFYSSSNLANLYFRGNAPTVAPFTGQFIAYYLPGTTGWGTHFAGRPTALWLPRLHQAGVQPAAASNAFGFTVAWASGQTVVIEACTNLTSPVWTGLHLGTLTNDSVRFHDLDWTNHPIRFYRVMAVDVPAGVIQ